MKALKKRLKDQRGLTLIELLAVIVILGIIAAIAVPSVFGIINKTKEDAKVAEAIQVINSAKLYVTTNPTAVSLDEGDLAQYMENLKDTDFTVTISTTNPKVYTLTDHDAAPIVNGTGSTSVTEAQLLSHSGN